MESLKTLNRALVNFGATMASGIAADHMLAISESFGIVVCAIDNGTQLPVFFPAPWRICDALISFGLTLKLDTVLFLHLQNCIGQNIGIGTRAKICVACLTHRKRRLARMCGLETFAQ